MKKIRITLVTLAMVAGLTLAIQTPAHASFDWCHGAGVVCFAEHTYGNGYRWGPTTLVPYGQCIGVPGPLDNKISSLWNKYGIDGTAPLQLTGYASSSCSSRLYTWGPGAYVLDIGYTNRDRISSVCLGPRTPGYCP